MKKIVNMNYEDAVKAFQSFSKKHPIDDDYDMNALVINQIKNLLDNKNFADIIYNIYCYGFMSGAKQIAVETAKKHDKVFAMSTEKHHKDLVELAYNLPFGTCADYFYTFMVLKLNEEYNGISKLLPAKQRKQFEETVSQCGKELTEKATKKSSCQAQQDEKEAYTNETEDKKHIIIQSILNCNNLHWIRCIYSYVTHLLK